MLIVLIFLIDLNLIFDCFLYWLYEICCCPIISQALGSGRRSCILDRRSLSQLLCWYWIWSSHSQFFSKFYNFKTYCDPNHEKWFLPSTKIPNSFSQALGSGRRSCILDRRPLQPTKISSKILSCRVWTIHNFKNGENPKVGFWRAVLKMELWIWPFFCSIFLSLSIFFYPLKYPINFQTEQAPTSTS